MKLYHASPIENKENILEYGIYSNESDKISNDERLSGSYVFGFNNIADAINFITDNIRSARLRCYPGYRI